MRDRPQVITALGHGVVRILAPNPSPMTHWGTNCYLLGTGAERILIDAGPRDPAHREAVLSALPKGARIAAIAITHAHLDHSAGANDLAHATGAPVYAFGTADAGRSSVMARLAKGELAQGGEGVDAAFTPDIIVEDGETIRVDGAQVTALHTPGHMGNHLAFAWGQACFTGDLVMGWSSSLISPPDGDARAYRDSCNRLFEFGFARFLPGHGAPIDAPTERIAQLLAHRAHREAQILAQLTLGPRDLTALTAAIYTDLPAQALPYAARNTFAHLVDLVEQKKVACTPTLSETALFSRQIPETKSF
ncbi:MBL fold metallo-hydrolase [Celeribacter marinus]|uniref:MBL fold metallo-hydrolase n=1 Tax=Celeribacter marinus TaxID=1397108 RepID=UPI003176BE63